MVNPEKLARTLRTLRIFVDRSLGLEDRAVSVKGFQFNLGLLEAASHNTYVETVSDKSDMLYSRIKDSRVDMIQWSYLDVVKVVSKRFLLGEKDVMLAFDYTDEEFYGNVQGFDIHGCKKNGGVTGKFKFLTCSIVSDEIPQKIPLISVPIQLGHLMSKEVCYCLALIRKFVGNISLILFDRGYYSKDLMYTLTTSGYPYLIFIPKNPQVETELEQMKAKEEKLALYEFEFKKDKTKLKGQTYQAFLKQIYCKKLDENIDWAFATNVKDIELTDIIKTYKKRWRIETGFRVQDEARIKSKSTDMQIRYFVFQYTQLIQMLWMCFFKEEVSFKKFIIELNKTCNYLVNKANKRNQ